MRPCADPEWVIGGPDLPGKSQVIWVFIEINTWTTTPPPQKKLDPLDPWKSIVFSVIKSPALSRYLFKDVYVFGVPKNLTLRTLDLEVI